MNNDIEVTITNDGIEKRVILVPRVPRVKSPNRDCKSHKRSNTQKPGDSSTANKSGGVEQDKKVPCQFGNETLWKCLHSPVNILFKNFFDVSGVYPSELCMLFVFIVVVWNPVILNPVQTLTNMNIVEKINAIYNSIKDTPRSEGFDQKFYNADWIIIVNLVRIWKKNFRLIRYCNNHCSAHWCVYNLLNFLWDYYVIWYIMDEVLNNSWDGVTFALSLHFLSFILRRFFCWSGHYTSFIHIYINVGSVLILLFLSALFAPVFLSQYMAWAVDAVRFKSNKKAQTWDHTMPVIPNGCYDFTKKSFVMNVCWDYEKWKNVPFSLENLIINISWWGHNKGLPPNATFCFVTFAAQSSGKVLIFIYICYGTALYFYYRPS